MVLERKRPRARWLGATLASLVACSGADPTALFDENEPSMTVGGKGQSETRAGQGGASGAGEEPLQGGSPDAAGNASGGRASAGGSGGSGGSDGGAGSGGAAGSGAAGSGGMAVTCPADCARDADCSVVGGVATCKCRSGSVGNGKVCARPTSCNELHQAAPALASGPYLIAPADASAPFMAYCEMLAEGGGWTLALNAGASFDQSAPGTAGAQCYRQDCTSLAYSTTPVVGDVMLDVADDALVGENQVARIVITGVASGTRGKTLRALISGGPSYLEKEDNSNVVVRVSGGGSCAGALPSDMAALVCNSCAAGEACDAPVLVLGDSDPGCSDTPFHFAIGGAESYSAAWGNCAGWPQSPSVGDIRYYPEHFRIWIR